MYKKIITPILIFLLVQQISQAQYISEVLEYKPAPGQFVNSAPWGVPSSTKSIEGNITGAMSLGAFGGYVIFKFENPVENHPDNPYGVDFTIFGNPLKDWSEQGIVSVMKDENGNGLPDDTWYELAGSEYFFSSTIKNYEVTYTNPNQATAADVSWVDNQGNTGAVSRNGAHSQPYYPLNDSFPDVSSDSYTLTGTRVIDEVDRTIPTYVKSYRKAFGYVDSQFRGVAPYTVPDNPYTPEKENSGGDAFDIGWAVDENGNYVDLDVVHFIKVHNGVLANAGWLGEISTEITGAVDVAPDNSITGETELLLINLPDTIIGDDFDIEAFAYNNGRWDKEAKINWNTSLSDASVNTENQLTFSASGKLILNASLNENSSIAVVDSTVLIYKASSASIKDNTIASIKVFPNPASEFIVIEGVSKASIEIYSLTGKALFKQANYTEGNPVSIKNLPKGMYILQVCSKNFNKAIRFVRN